MELIFNAAVALFMLGYMYLALQLGASNITGDIFGAGGFPVFVAGLGLAVLSYISYNVYKSKHSVTIPMFDFKSASGKSLGLNVLSLTAYVLLMDVIGFAISTPLFLIASTRSMGYKNIKPLILYTVIVTAALLIVFGKVFFIPLPRGTGIFRELSYMIY